VFEGAQRSDLDVPSELSWRRRTSACVKKERGCGEDERLNGVEEEPRQLWRRLKTVVMNFGTEGVPASFRVNFLS